MVDIIANTYSSAALVFPITAIGGIVVAIVSIITYRSTQRRFRLTSLIEAFRMLDNHKHREARRVLYSRDNITSLSFEILELGSPTKEGGPTIDDLLTLSKDIVRTDFNEIGILIHYDLLDGEIFVREFYWVILRIWQLVKEDIMNRRNDVGPPNYMEHLEEMHKMALDYARENQPKVYQEFSETHDENELGEKAPDDKAT